MDAPAWSFLTVTFADIETEVSVASMRQVIDCVNFMMWLVGLYDVVEQSRMAAGLVYWLVNGDWIVIDFRVR